MEKEVKLTMYAHECHPGASCQCGCGGVMSVEDEIRALEVQSAHLKLQQEMIEKRISGLKNAGT
ncbi:MAG TPA: hypothetical protein VLL74_03335 [Methanoregula sp.]|nr:hypothetical protein [Methanoregula sp.]